MFRTASGGNGQWENTTEINSPMLNINNYTTNNVAGSGSITLPFSNINLPLQPNDPCNQLNVIQQLLVNTSNLPIISMIQETFIPTVPPGFPPIQPITLPSNVSQPVITSSLAPPVPTSQSVPDIDTTETPDPINIATGESYFSSTDFSLNARGPKLTLFRKYRSLSTFIGMFGYGWRTDYDANLTTDSTGDVTIYDRDGTGMYFMNNSGTYTPSPGNYSTIIKNADNTYTLTDKNGIVTHYDINGRLTPAQTATAIA